MPVVNARQAQADELACFASVYVLIVRQV